MSCSFGGVRLESEARYRAETSSTAAGQPGPPGRENSVSGDVPDARSLVTHDGARRPELVRRDDERRGRDVIRERVLAAVGEQVRGQSHRTRLADERQARKLLKQGLLLKKPERERAGHDADALLVHESPETEAAAVMTAVMLLVLHDLGGPDDDGLGSARTVEGQRAGLVLRVVTTGHGSHSP